MEAVTGPGWLVESLAALMLATALYCVAHLIASWVHARDAEPDVDLMHVAMGVAMAGMLVAAFDHHANVDFGLGFAGCATWFAVRGVGDLVHRHTGRRTRHHGQHVIACATMVYMFAGSSAPVAQAHASIPAMHHATDPVVASQPSIAALGLTVVLLCCAGWNVAELVAAEQRSTRLGGPAPMLAPRLGIGCAIAMSATMGYLLLTG